MMTPSPSHLSFETGEPSSQASHLRGRAVRGPSTDLDLARRQSEHGQSEA